MLRYHLLELMPEHEGQRRLLPKIEIQLTKAIVVNFKMLIRKGKRRSQLQHDPMPALEELGGQVEELLVIRENLQRHRLFFHGREPIIVPLIDALGD